MDSVKIEAVYIVDCQTFEKVVADLPAFIDNV